MGLHPLFNYFVITALFFGVSYSLFSHNPKTLVAYIFIALNVVSLHSSPAHSGFLRIHYSRVDYYKIRLTENTITVFPFALLLSISANYLAALGVLIASILMALIRKTFKWHFVIPTPFSRHPFEFTAGFRLSFLLILLGYYLTFISIYHANFGIGVFVIYAFGVLCALFHGYPEDAHYVWIFSCKATKFLHYKLLTAWAYTTLLSLPVLLALIWANPAKAELLILTHCVSLAVVSAGVLSKYATFPLDINLREGLLLMFSLMFPPLLLFSLPFFYLRSLRQLKEILP